LPKKIVACMLLLALAAPAAAGFFDALTGALSWTVELAALLAAKQPRLKAVYLAHYGADGPAGTVHPTLTVGPDGAVKDVVWESDTLGNAAFTADLAREIRTWKMPQTTWNMKLGFDLEFDPGRDLFGVDVSAGTE